MDSRLLPLTPAGRYAALRVQIGCPADLSNPLVGFKSLVASVIAISNVVP